MIKFELIRILAKCLIFFAALILKSYSSFSQANADLPGSTPESEGVSSAEIIKFLAATAHSKTEFHSFMLLRHGKLIAEGWWNPYAPELKHTLYSCSKSFTATAIGLALNEKLISLNDRVVSFFPKDLPDTVSPFLSELTIKDVLMMSDGMEPDPSFEVVFKDSNWVKGFLAVPIKNKPGTKFLYNSLGTYMLSAIIQKVTGLKTIDYLRLRLFDPLQIYGMDWETDTRGINTGGWGLRLKTEDMAKFAQLFLQKGNWNGRQILPASWIEQASTVKIMQDPEAPPSRKDSSDWLQGYCYQMWRCRHNAYRGDGAFGQFMIVMPDQDAVIAITAETPDMQEEINLVWNFLLPAFKNGELKPDPEDDKQLAEMTKSLSLPLPVKNDVTLENSLSGKNFSMGQNKLGFQEMSFSFKNGECTVNLQVNKNNYQLTFGSGKWTYGQTDMPGPSLVANSIQNNSMIYPAKVTGSYTWKDANTLELVLRYIESPHTETITCRFQQNQLSATVNSSFEFGKNPVIFHGSAL